jgi:hypothetical protein
MVAQNPVDLLEVAKGLDPRFAENMPEEVAKAFSEGRVTHVFRTSDALSNIQENINAGEQFIPTGGLNMADQQMGSIYVRTKEGATARWKLPELSIGDDAGWNANRGYGAFMDVGAEPVLGKKAYEEMNLPNGGKVTHPGHNVVDVYDASGSRSYLQFDPKTNTMHSLSENITAQMPSTTAAQTATVSPGVSNLGESAADRVRNGPRHVTPPKRKPIIPAAAATEEVKTATSGATAAVTATAHTGTHTGTGALAHSVARAEGEVAGKAASDAARGLSQAVAGKSSHLGAIGLATVIGLGTLSVFKRNKENRNRLVQQQAYNAGNSAANIKSINY